jgi:hypothetical protein
VDIPAGDAVNADHGNETGQRAAIFIAVNLITLSGSLNTENGAIDASVEGSHEYALEPKMSK